MTYQNYQVDWRMKTNQFESNNFLHILFIAIFVTAVFVVPTVGITHFLFF